jgi:hypothetical protein
MALRLLVFGHNTKAALLPFRSGARTAERVLTTTAAIRANVTPTAAITTVRYRRRVLRKR